MIDFQPDDEQQLVIETVRQFAENEIRPLARDCDESAKIPDGVLAQAHELGLVANALPEAQGGGGERSAVTGSLIAEELARGDLAIALAILSPSLSGLPVADHGDESQRQRVIGPLTGTSFVPGALAVSEPTRDVDAYRPATRAERKGSGYVLTGRKCLVPWLDAGEHVVVTACLDGEPEAFVVPRDASGLASERERNLGLQALPTVELELSGVAVGVDARLYATSGAVADIVTRGRVATAACGVGMARSAFEIARDYAKQREAFGAPIASKQAIAFKLADMAIEIDGARMLVWEAAWRLDQGLDATREAALARHQVRRVALEVADGAVQVLGGHGYTREYLPEMHLRNASGFACFEALTIV